MLTAPFRAVADLPFYKEVIRKSPGWLAGYLCLLGLAFAIAAAVSLAIRVGPMIEETMEWAATSLPTITFAGGKVTSSAQGPVRVQHPTAEQVAFIIDTDRTTAVTAQELQERKVVAYLAQNVIYVAPRPEKVEAYDLGKLMGAPQQPTVLDSAFYRAVGEALPKILYPLTFVMTWFFFVSWKSAASLVYAVLALVINGMVKGGLEFPQLWKLAVVAQTPVILLQMAQMFLPAPIPLFSLIALIVAGVYLWQGIRQNAVAEPAAPAA